MSSKAPQRSNPERAARSRTRLDQKKPIRKLTGRAVQTRQTFPASRVVVTVQEDPESPGMANVQIMRRVSQTSNPQQPSTTPSMSERLANQLSDLLSSFLSRQTPAERLEQAREEQRKLQEVAKNEEEEEEEVTKQ